MCNVQCKKEGCSARRSMSDKIGDEFAALLLCKVSIILPLSGKRKRIVDLTPMHLASIRRSNILDKDASSHAPEKAVKARQALALCHHSSFRVVLQYRINQEDQISRNSSFTCSISGKGYHCWEGRQLELTMWTFRFIHDPRQPPAPSRAEAKPSFQTPLPSSA